VDLGEPRRAERKVAAVFENRAEHGDERASTAVEARVSFWKRTQPFPKVTHRWCAASLESEGLSESFANERRAVERRGVSERVESVSEQNRQGDPLAHFVVRGPVQRIHVSVVVFAFAASRS
jgi:hypothetical protein